MRLNKKGLSPIIAETLLIVLVMVIILIIFIWVRSFVGEQITKNLGEEPESIEIVCEKVEFRAESQVDSSGMLIMDIVNSGNIPIYQIELKQKKGGAVKTIPTHVSFTSGESLLGGETDSGINTGIDIVKTGEKLIVTPVLVGETDGNIKTYVCDEQGIEIDVK